MMDVEIPWLKRFDEKPKEEPDDQTDYEVMLM